MKKTALILMLAATVMFSCKNGENKEVTSEDVVETADREIIDNHNSQNSLDWAGVYEGTTPCADCEGIKTVLELKDNETFTLSQTYLGKVDGENEFTQNGTFEWNADGSVIHLKSENDRFQFKVGENQIWMLDAEGKMIEGELADFYVLKKKA